MAGDLTVVMAGLVPAIHDWVCCSAGIVDARPKAGHDKQKVNR
jgi:hypothetical protein